MNGKYRTGGFTLVELLVVVAIISVLVSILVPVVGNSLQDARRVVCATNIKEIGSAVNAYTRANNDSYPTVRSKTNPQVRWITLLGPYIGGSVVDPNIESLPSNGNMIISNAFRCPNIAASKYQLPPGKNRGDYARTGSYGYNWMTFGPFAPQATGLQRYGPVARSQIAKPAQTILVGDSFGDAAMTGQPHAYTLDPPVALQGRWGDSGSGLQCPADPRHGGQFNAVFADGNVRSLTMTQAGYDNEDPTAVGGTGDPSLWNGFYDPSITLFTD